MSQRYSDLEALRMVLVDLERKFPGSVIIDPATGGGEVSLGGHWNNLTIPKMISALPITSKAIPAKLAFLG